MNKPFEPKPKTKSELAVAAIEARNACQSRAIATNDVVFAMLAELLDKLTEYVDYRE
jgi:hypothetical protein